MSERKPLKEELAKLLDPTPVGVCTACRRKTWSEAQIGLRCSMRQPDSSHCRGVIVRPNGDGREVLRAEERDDG
jgi:hypothetical protein